MSGAIKVRRGFRVPFAQLPEALLDDLQVTDRAVRLWGMLDRYAGADGLAFPSRGTLASRLGCSPDSLDRAIRCLEDAGWLHVERRIRRVGVTNEPNLYTLLNPAGEPDAPTVEAATPSRTGAASPSRTDAATPSRTGAAHNESQLNERTSTPRRASAPRGEAEVLALVEVAEGGPWSRPPADAVRQVFDAWRESVGRPDATLDRRRRQVIERALTTAPLARVLLAVRGWSYDRWSNGDHDGVTRNQVGDLIGDADKIDRYAAAGERGALPTPRPTPRRLSAHEQHQADLMAAARAFTTSDPTRMLGA
jgi:hypothetical protein